MNLRFSFIDKYKKNPYLKQMSKPSKYEKPEATDIGSAKEIIKGGPFNKETGGADGLFDGDDNPVSVPD